LTHITSEKGTKKKILITGTAGFIGFHLVQRLVREGYEITGLDNINDYYDVNLKYARLEETGIPQSQIGYNTYVQSHTHGAYRFIKLSLEDKENILKVFMDGSFDYVVHLAAQAGVRYSLVNPHAYIDSNITGFLNILEGCRHYPVRHLIYASSSSVYGANTKMPFSTGDNVDHPVSLYAASKKANELMAHTYANIFSIPSTGLRFFTVYGPWGRPDMALFIFTKAILHDQPIDVFNNGDMKRDFTYIDDIIEGVVRLVPKAPSPDTQWNGSDPDPSTSFAPYKIYNIGNNSPVKLLDFIEAIEHHAGKQAVKNYMPLQPGDVPATYADVTDLMADVGFKPGTPVQTGVGKFIEWYRSYYNESIQA
jgi:UDP-glucuronate 4-epimerase